MSDAGFTCSVDADRGAVTLAGEVDLAAVPVIEPQVEPLLADGGRVVIDLADVTFIDSTALAMFVRAQRTANEHGTQLTLARASTPVATLLRYTGTAGFFDLAD